MNKQIITLVLITLALVSVTSALRVTLSTPQATFRANLSDTINYYVGVENQNSFNVNITITSPEGLNITFQGPTQFELLPQEKRDVNYSILINKTGNYSYSIPVIFNGNATSFTLQSTLFFIVAGDETIITPPLPPVTSEGNNNEETTDSDYTPSNVEPSVIETIEVIVSNVSELDNTNTTDILDVTSSQISNENNKPYLTWHLILGLVIFISLVLILLIKINKRKNERRLRNE